MSTDNNNPPKKQTKKQRRRAAQRKQLMTFGAIVLLVVVVAGAVLGYQHWSENRPGTPPEDLRVTVTDASGEEQEYAPYSVCQLFTGDCDEGEPTEVELGPDDEMTISLPEEVYDHDWTMLQIFDDPAANTENSYTGNEKTEVTIKGSSDTAGENDENPRLAVVEIHSSLVGDDDGEEVAFGAVWSFTPAG